MMASDKVTAAEPKSSSAPSSPRKPSLSTENSPVLGHRETKEVEMEKLIAELDHWKTLHAQAVEALEQERSKIQNVNNLVNQIRTITAPELSPKTTEISEDTKMLHKLIEEKEAHAQTVGQLNDERKKLDENKTTIEGLGQRVKDLMRVHNSALSQLEEEKERVKQLQVKYNAKVSPATKEKEDHEHHHHHHHKGADSGSNSEMSSPLPSR